MLTFFGKFHPLFVHLPIGFISFWLIIEALERISSYKSGEKTKLLLLVSSAISSVISSLLGYFLSLNGEYNGELLDEHKWLGIWLSVLLTIISIFYYFLRTKSFFKYVYNTSIFGITILLTLTGHHGGSLTHGEDFLSLSQLSESKKSEKVEILDINQAVVFSELVQPIINQKCVSCHNSGKQKGGLRMDSFEEVMKGGENGVIVNVNNSSTSEMIKLINLDPIEERAMPPKGKTPLTNDEKAILTWWIDAGASKDKKVADLKPDANVLKILTKFQSGSKTNEHGAENATLEEISAADEKDIEKCQNLGISINKIAQNTNFLDARVVLNKKNWTDEKTESLLKLKEQIYILDLSETAISSKSTIYISEFSNLRSLFLQNTNLNDKDIENITKLEKLEVLNLYNVPITDLALSSVSKIKNLKKLYVWKTKISQDAILKLKQKFPKLEIISGTIIS